MIKQLHIFALILGIVSLSAFPTECYAQGKVTRKTTVKSKAIPKTGTENGYEWVDLGLPSGTKWAKHNIGATTPEGYGMYFAWGELLESVNNTYDAYPNSNAQLENVSYSGNGKYDVAKQKWGGRWVTPDLQNIEELLNHCKIVWSERNAHIGVNVTGPNGTTIFFSAAGMKTGIQYHWQPQLYGAYWVSTPSYRDSRYARMFLFEESSYNPGISAHECWKAFSTPIRPVIR